MGFLDNIFGDDGFVERAGETLQDAGWTVGAPFLAAVEVAKAGIPGGEPFVKTALKEVTQGFQRGTQLFFGDKNDPKNPDDDENNLLNPALGKAMDALDWVYDNAIAQPVNTTNILSQRLVADVRGIEDNASPFDLESAWDRADETKGGYAGKGTSIGREWANLVNGLNPFSDGSSLTGEGQRELDEHSRIYDVQSGGIDAAASFFLDPTIVLGKAAKVLRAEKVVAGLKGADEIPTKLEEQGSTLGFAGWGDRFDKAVDWASQDGRSAAELVAAFPGLSDSVDGAAIASVIEQTNKTLRAAGKSDEEVAEQVRLISLASLGDPNALKQIGDDAAFAKDALAAMQSSRDDLKTAADWAIQYSDRVTPDDIADAAEHLDLLRDLQMRGGRDYFTSDEFVKLTDARLSAVQKDIAAAEREAARQQRVAKMFLGTEDSTALAGTLATRPLLASATGSVKGLDKRAARERGEQAGLDVVFQSTIWNKGVKYVAPHIYLTEKAVRGFNKMAQPKIISVHDERAALQLDNFLKHSKLDPETRLQLVSKLAGAVGEQEKGRVVEQATQLAVQSIVDAHRLENPKFTDEMAKLVNESLAKEAARTRSRIAAHTQMFSAHKTTTDKDGIPAGSRGDMVIDDDGQAAFYPLLETQLVNTFSMPDLKAAEHILRRHSNWLTDMAEWAKGNRAPDPNRVSEIASRVFDTAAEKFPGLEVRTANRAQMVNDFIWKSEEFSKMTLEGFNRLWKNLTLATRPTAYAGRVNTESALRMVATLGPAAWMMKSFPRVVGYGTLGLATGAKRTRLAYRDAQRELEATKAMERLEDEFAAVNGRSIAEGDDEVYDQLKAQRDSLAARLELYRTGGRQGRNEAYPVFGAPGQKPIQTRAGEIEAALNSERGRIDQWLIASETSAAVIGDTRKMALKGAQLGNWTYVENTDPLHMDSWLRAVNAQLLQSVIGKRAVQYMDELGDPEKAADRLARWATGTPEGREIMGRLQWTWADKRVGAREVVGYVNHYLPSPELRHLAHTRGKVDQTDLETAFPNVTDRPPVHGESVAIATGRGSVVGEQINNTFSAILRWAGDATEDQLARHPMYAAVYEQEAKRRAEYLMADPRIEQLTGGDIKRLVQDQAHKAARQAIKNYMFDVATTSDLSHFMRFVSPFIAAWEDTVRKWSRIAKENPDVAGKAYLVWNAPNDMGLVVDSEGNPVDEDNFLGYRDPKTGEYRATYIVIPRGITKHLPGGADSEFKISKQAFNLVLQGGLQPGFGPLVAYPVGKIQTESPDLDKVAKLVNPYGPPKDWFDAMAPSTFKELRNAIDEQSRSHQQDTRRIYAALLAEYRNDPQKFGGKEPTIEDAAQKAGALGRLKVVNRVTNPFPFIFQSPYQMYIDAYRTLQDRERTEGHPRGWADDQFIKGYGESYFPLVQSESLNNAGLGSSQEAVQASKQYAALISKYGVEAGQAKPNLIRLIVGQEGEGEFNASAHQWQEAHQISPASGLPFRSYENPQAAQAAADADLGWLKYRQFMNTIDADAIQRGYTTYADDPELVETRKQFIANLQSENEAWHVEWSQRDSDAFERDLQALGEIATSGKFGPMRTDMTGVQQYLALRQALIEQLQEYEVTPGSQDAQPFRREFTDAVQALVSQNSQFAEWSYYTFLERDPLLEPIVPMGQLTADTEWGFSGT